MFGKTVTLFSLLGFKVQIDMSWLLLAALVIWSLAEGVFPSMHEGLSTSTYWLLGFVGTLGFFLSLILHELSHSIVARRRGMPIRGITLFIFGGVAHMEDEPPSANTELLMAIAGPLASISIAGVLYLGYLAGRSAGFPEHFLDVPYYLAFINVILAGFNLLPAFPLDGGRVFRALLWRWKGNIRWATRIAAALGSGFGLALVALGVLWFFGGNFLGGFWWFLIGLFLRGAARASYQQLLTRQALEGESVRRFMVSDPKTVEPELSIRDLVEDYIYKYHHDVFPVTQDSHLLGCIGIKEAKQTPRDEWDRHKVEEMLTPCSDANTIDADTDAVKALSIMSRTGNSRLMVTEGDRLVGIIALKDMLQLLSVKLDLEDVK
jgi:Zn-dependent protease/CBS domain-containing protein